MKVKNAIKKLAQFGEVEKNGNTYSAIINGYDLSFICNGGDEPENNITCIYLRPETQEDDVMTDYWAGTFYPNLQQALKSAGAIA